MLLEELNMRIRENGINLTLMYLPLSEQFPAA